MEAIEKMLAYAKDKLGCRYSQTRRWEEGIYDCSSLVYRAFWAAGVPMVHRRTGAPVDTSNLQVYARGFRLLEPPGGGPIGRRVAVDYSQLKPGDLIFYTFGPTDRENRITHVSIVLDGETVLHARNPQMGVLVNDMGYGRGNIVAVTRYVGE